MLVYLNAADEKKIFDFDTIEAAIASYEKNVEYYKNNVYFYSDEDGYHVMYDPEAKLEADYSFLQIFNSEKFEDAIVEYRRTTERKNLYIKKFYSLYFLRLSNKDIKYTQKMFLDLQGRFPKIYHSKLPTKDDGEDLDDLSDSKVVFLKDRFSMVNTDPVNEIVVSTTKEDIIPNLKNDYNIKVNRVKRKSNMQVINDLEGSIANFGIVRGDILGLKNLGLYDLGVFNNYGILCKNSDSLLYLVSRKEINSIYDLRAHTISTGNVTDIAQIYLKNAIDNTGILKDYHFKALGIADSMKALEKNEIDSFFLFAPRDYIYTFLKKGFHISSIPSKIREVLNKQDGLDVIKYKIDDRLVLTYQTPNYVISPLATLDQNIVKKIEVVADKFGCYENMKMPNPFYGQVHPEFLKALDALKAKLEAQKAAQLAANALAAKQNGVSITFMERKKYDDYTDYLYKIENTTAESVSVIFESIKTNYFDDYAIKAHHIFRLNTKSDQIMLEPASSKVVSFKYQNPFAIRVNDLNVDLIFKDTRFSDRRIVLPVVIGDKL